MTHTTNHERLLVPESEAAELLGGISTRTLFTWRRAGKLPYVKISGKVLYSMESLKRFIQDNERTGGPSDAH